MGWSHQYGEVASLCEERGNTWYGSSSCLPALAAGEALKIVDAKFQGYGVPKMRKLLRVNQAGYRTNDGRAIGSR